MANNLTSVDKQVGQSRAISESRYSTSKDEKRLILLAMLNENKTKILEGRWFDFRLADYARVFNVSLHESSRDTQKAIENLQDRWIYLKKEDGVFEKVRWIDGIRASLKQGTKGVRFTAEMVEVLKNTPDQYTYQLGEVVSLSSPEHIRIYDWIYDAVFLRGQKQVTLSLDEMRHRMQLDNHKSYRLYGNLKRAILTPAIQKISTETSIEVSMEEVKEGRKVVAVTFFGALKKDKNQ